LQRWTIVGWGMGHALFEKRWIRSWDDGPDTYWIPASALEDWPPRLPLPHLDTRGLRP
jgi:hypothetical protein